MLHSGARLSAPLFSIPIVGCRELNGRRARAGFPPNSSTLLTARGDVVRLRLSWGKVLSGASVIELLAILGRDGWLTSLVVFLQMLLGLE